MAGALSTAGRKYLRTHTKESLLAQLIATHDEIEALVAPISDEQLTMVGITSDWSLRDVIAHLGVWMRRAIAKIHDIPMPPLRLPHEEGDAFWDRINVVIVEDARRKTVSQVRGEFALAYQEMLEYIQLLNANDMANQELMDTVYMNSIGHLQDHLPTIRSWVIHLQQGERAGHTATLVLSGKPPSVDVAPAPISSVKVFISHSRADNQFCQRLVKALQQAGADVWLDENSLGAALLTERIEKELRMRPIFIVVLSPEALASRWVEDESRWAYTLFKRDPERARIILPVVARAIQEDDIWLFLAEFRRVGDRNQTPFDVTETIRLTLDALALTPLGHSKAAMAAPGAYTVLDLLERGTLLIQQKRYEAALAFAEVATLLDTGFSAAWSSKARALNYLWRAEETVLAADEAIRLDPNNAMAWNYRGNALTDLQRFDEALVCYDRALELADEYALAWNNRGYALQCLGLYIGAIRCFDRAIALDPEYTLAMLNKGWCLHSLGRLAEALEMYDQALAINGLLAMGWHHKIATLRALGHESEAEAAQARTTAMGLTLSSKWTSDDADFGADTKTII